MLHLCLNRPVISVLTWTTLSFCRLNIVCIIRNAEEIWFMHISNEKALVINENSWAENSDHY